MKDFNIEQLAKKTPYKIPENTFEEMQENVFNKTVRKKEHQPKIFKINFSMVTSIAAALALIFGFTFLWKTNQTEFSKPSQDSVQSITKVETIQPKPEQNNTQNSLQNIVKENNSEVVNTAEIENTAYDMIEWMVEDVANGYLDSTYADTYIDNLEQIIKEVR